MNPRVDEFLQHLREHLNWPRVEAVDNDGLLCIRCLPDNPSHEAIGLWIDGDLQRVEALGMGIWHYHPDTLDEAVAMMGTLIRSEQFVLEQYSSTGRYAGSGPQRPGALPDMLPLDIGWLIERPFNQEPRRREADLSRYFRGRHHYVELEFKLRTEKVWRDVGMDERF
jgi:hypothetical protein